MGIFIPVIESLLGGYLAAVAVQLVLSLVITRLGRKALMNDDAMSGTYYLLLALSWIISAAAGGFVAAGTAPFGPAGPYIFSVLLAIILIAVLVRNHMDTRHQQSPQVNATVYTCIVVGAVGGSLVHLI